MKKMTLPIKWHTTYKLSLVGSSLFCLCFTLLSKQQWIFIVDPNHYDFHFEYALKHLGVDIDEDGKYDFANAKRLVLFCNGPWCTQSPDMIYALLEIGYPAEKLKWYRGGIQDWLGVGMTSTREVAFK